MSKSYFEFYAKQPLLDVVEFKRDPAIPNVDGIEVEHHDDVSDEQWAALVKRLAGEGR